MQYVTNRPKVEIGWWLGGIALIFFACHFSYHFLLFAFPTFQLLGSVLAVVSIPLSALLGYKLPLMDFTTQTLLKCGCAIFVGISAAYCIRFMVDRVDVAIWKEVCWSTLLNIGIYALVCLLAVSYRKTDSVKFMKAASRYSDDSSEIIGA